MNTLTKLKTSEVSSFLDQTNQFWSISDPDINFRESFDNKWPENINYTIVIVKHRWTFYSHHTDTYDTNISCIENQNDINTSYNKDK